MFSKSANYYDEIYAAVGKDYPAEEKENAVHEIVNGVLCFDNSGIKSPVCGPRH